MSTKPLSAKLNDARFKYAPKTYHGTTEWFSVHLREMPNGECQVIEYTPNGDPRPRENGVVILARAKTWKELNL